jgi:hypothetical protein
MSVLALNAGDASPVDCPHCFASLPVSSAFDHIDLCEDAKARAVAAAHPEWPPALVAAFLPGSRRQTRHAAPAASGALVREADVSEVVPGAFIASVVVGKSAARLRALGVHALVNCIPDTEARPLDDEQLGESGVGACCLLNMEDKFLPGYERRIRGGALAIAEARAEGKSGLVHCAMGVSRSATVMLAFLVEHHVEGEAAAAAAPAVVPAAASAAAPAAAPEAAAPAADAAAGGAAAEPAPPAAAAAVAKRKGMRLADAFLLLKAARPMVMPNHGFWQCLLAIEKEARGENSVPPEMLALCTEMLPKGP